MQFVDIRNLALSWLDDLNAGYFTPSQINRFINNAQYEVQKELLLAGENWYLKPVQTTLVVNQQDYVLPLDFVHLNRLSIITSGAGTSSQNEVPLAPITLNQLDLVPNNTGQPQYYVIKRNRLMLFPFPDTAYPMLLYYSPIVAEMVLDTDIPNIPTQFHEYIAVLATYDGLIKDNRPVESITIKMNNYRQMLKSEAAARNQDAPRNVVITGEGAGYSFGYW